jgi:hypothetical protein
MSPSRAFREKNSSYSKSSTGAHCHGRISDGGRYVGTVAGRIGYRAINVQESKCCELAPHIPEDSMDLYRPTWTLEVT